MLNGNSEQISKKSLGGEIGGESRGPELKGVSTQIKLEVQRRDVKQRIIVALNDEGVALEKRVVVKKEELLEKRYQNYSQTIDGMNSLDKIANFEREILQVIAEQRNEYRTMKEALSWGKRTIENGNFNQAVKAQDFLWRCHKLQEQKKILLIIIFFSMDVSMNFGH